MQINDLMSRFIVSVSPGTSVHDAAQRMQKHGIGALPILDGGDPVGIITDRDIVTRILSVGDARADTPVGPAMSPRPAFCLADQDVTVAAALMGDLQVRRLLVRDRRGRVVGVLSIGDIAEKASEELAGQVLGEVTERR
ncbi:MULTISPECIES: CBS domain-containing protein [Sediminimonas]|uniref:CBS domain-containing protein n=1 Tax=Sediminimonas TaxID=659427 RepID=UPI0004106269|nr:MULTISPECIES: CBS domain-containing protein [Sediminimonas]MDR9486073.1 CBS domain-containing protein [Sediminimonas sp.]